MKFINAYPILSFLIVFLIIAAVSYYFMVVRYEKKERKRHKEMSDTFFDTRKFRNTHKN